MLLRHPSSPSLLLPSLPLPPPFLSLLSPIAQVDFANRCVSGSTLEGGCVQEEIRFAICPELLVSRLVLELLEDNEAVVITVSETFRI